MAKTYGIGIMGAGNISSAYIRLAPLFKGLEVRGVADIIPAAARARGAEFGVAAMTPDGFTRLGTAIRHATAQLARQSAGHRLLLILSDGRPHDVDAYQGPYGVEDTRQAVLEARTSGVFPFCLTVDFDTLEDQAVTIRHRDSMEQVRVSLDQVAGYLAQRLIGA